MRYALVTGRAAPLIDEVNILQANRRVVGAAAEALAASRRPRIGQDD